MNHLEITSEEQEILQQVLKGYLARLEVEINHTDNSGFKTLLKHRRQIINQLLDRMAGLPMAVG